MTEDQLEIVSHFENLRILPGTFDKRFITAMISHAKLTPNRVLTEKQNEWMFRLLFKYRRQLYKIYPKYHDHPLCCAK